MLFYNNIVFYTKKQEKGRKMRKQGNGLSAGSTGRQKNARVLAEKAET